MRKLAIDVHPQEYSVCRFAADQTVDPALLSAPGLVSITRTEDETSIIVASAQRPVGGDVESGWRRLTVRGPLEFTLTGIMAAIAGALAAAGVTLFALSTFDTDHVLVKQEDLARAVAALTEAGHLVTET